jgi:hypothetical protein
MLRIIYQLLGLHGRRYGSGYCLVGLTKSIDKGGAVGDNRLHVVSHLKLCGPRFRPRGRCDSASSSPQNRVAAVEIEILAGEGIGVSSQPGRYRGNGGK